MLQSKQSGWVYAEAAQEEQMKYLLLGTFLVSIAFSSAYSQSFNATSLYTIHSNSLQARRDRVAVPPPAPPTQGQIDNTLVPSRWGTVGQQGVGQTVWGSYGPPVGTLSGAPPIGAPIGVAVGAPVGVPVGAPIGTPSGSQVVQPALVPSHAQR